VVIAIIGILASLLLPALRSARERGRCVVCASNQRQIYTGAMMYGGDYDGTLCGGTMIGAGTGGYRVDFDPANLLYFFSEYLNVAPEYHRPSALRGQEVPAEDLIPSAPNDTYQMGELGERGVGQCPGNTDVGGAFRLAYALYGFGSVWYNGSQASSIPARLPRLARLGTYRDYPMIFSMDSIYLVPSTLSYMQFRWNNATNHINRDPQGSNVCAGDGSVAWIPLEDHVMPLWDWGVPRGYWLKYSSRTDGFSVFNPISGSRQNITDTSAF